jgi:hypothetical protein
MSLALPWQYSNRARKKNPIKKTLRLVSSKQGKVLPAHNTMSTCEAVEVQLQTYLFFISDGVE